MKREQLDLNLLPLKFKIVAIALLIISVLFAVLFKLEVFEMAKNIADTISKIGVLLSLLILALTKNKIEDELTLRIRLRAFAVSFIFGVGIVIVEPFVNVLFGDQFFLSDEGVVKLLISMFFFYFVTIFIMKRNR